MVECNVCGREFDSQRGMKTHRGRSHRDWLRERISKLYIKRGLSPKEIGEELDMARQTVGQWVREFNISGKQPPTYHLEGHKLNGPYVGYPRWTGTGTGHRVRVHRLLMIAKGADPEKVFGPNHSIHHINGHPLDNRKENLKLMKKEKHGAKDGKRSAVGYSHKEYLKALIQQPPEWAQKLRDSDE